MGAGASANNVDEHHQKVADSALYLIDSLKSIPLEQRKQALSQIALLMGGDEDGNGVIDEDELKNFVKNFSGMGAVQVESAAASIGLNDGASEAKSAVDAEGGKETATPPAEEAAAAAEEAAAPTEEAAAPTEEAAAAEEAAAPTEEAAEEATAPTEEAAAAEEAAAPTEEAAEEAAAPTEEDAAPTEEAAAAEEAAAPTEETTKAAE